jgi:hypothetical protein
MIAIDLQKMAALSEDLYTSAAKTAFGDNGCAALQHLLAGIVQIYQRLDPGIRTAPLALFADATDSPAVVAGIPRTLHSIANLAHELDGASCGSSPTIRCRFTR